MQSQFNQSKIYAAALSGLATGCWCPKSVPIQSIRSGSLDADGKVNHAEALLHQSGNTRKCLSLQDRWKSSLENSKKELCVEAELTISEMTIAATQSLRSRLRGSNCVAVNSQSTRDSGYSHATAARMLFEAGCFGSSHTTSHCGCTGFYMALEHAILIASAEQKETLVVTTGERWLDIYPRCLGNWANLSDGASAFVASFHHHQAATVWVLNAALENSDFMSTLETGNPPIGIVEQSANALRTLIAEIAPRKPSKIHVLLPAAGNGFCCEVKSLVQNMHDFDFTFPPTSKHYFGSADALMRLHRFQLNWDGAAKNDEYCLLWDYEPNGLFGATLIQVSSILNAPQELAA